MNLMQKITNWIMPYKAQLILLLLSLMVFPNNLQALPGFAHGWLYSRGVVTNDLGQYTWSRYDVDTGDYLGDIGVADSSLDPDEWRVMSGDEYRNIIKQKADLHKAQEDLLFLSRLAYESIPLLLANGEVMKKPSLSDTTGFVSLLPPSRRFIDDPESIILAEYPVNPGVVVADNIVSILYKYRGDNIGAIRLQSTNRIGFKVAFVKDANGNTDPNNETHNFGSNGNLPVSPLANIGIDSALRGGGMTNEDGHFTAIWHYPPCPIVPFNYSNLLTANLYFSHFNPRLTSRLNFTTTATRTVYDACIPELFYIPIIGYWPLSSGRIDPHLERILFTVDFSYLSGVAYLSDHVSVMNNRVQMDGNKVPVTSKSQYQAEVADNTLTTAQYYDFDRDKIIDTVLSGHLEDKPVDEGENECEAKGKTQKFVAGDPKDLQGVWLSSGGHTPSNCQPDFTRIIDHESYKNKNHQGLLSEISAEDLRNTDIYIVRLSDGKLISERIGLNESEYFLGEDQERDRFFYTLGVYGNRRGGFLSERFISFEDWQSKNGMNPELHERKADHVKPGDSLRIYAINRATGYIGHVDTIYEIMSENSALLGNKIDPIIMGPPNLRIKVERGYKIENGATASEKVINKLIGFEGASLTSDKLVTITTEWLDSEGRPMPESLKDAGYTGRIAILSGDKTLPGNNQGVYQFAIEPGQHLQVIQLPNALTDKEHFYIHVSGEPKSGQAVFAGSTNNVRHGEIDFKSTGQNQGILEKRPDHFVPFLVPIYDENATELQMQAYRIYKSNHYATAPEPIYRWVYRPEMQFTSYDLFMSGINKSDDADNNGTIDAEETVNILGTSTTISSSDVIEILYDLSTTDLLPLDFFNAGPLKELVFVVGEQEIKATIDDSQTIKFDDLSYLDLLNPDEYLAISLYANNDMGNTLWEYGFYSVNSAVDLNRDGIVAFSKEEDSTDIKMSDKTSAIKPFRFWLNDNFDVVSNDGSIDESIPFCPPYTGDQVCEQMDAKGAEGTSNKTNISEKNLEIIESEKDLEDFAPLKLKVVAPRDTQGYTDLSDVQAFLTVQGIGINVFNGAWKEGTDYLTDKIIMKDQVKNLASDHYLFELEKNIEYELSPLEIKKMFGQSGEANLIFEGTAASNQGCVADSKDCYLEFALKKSGEVIASTKVYLNILPITHFYDHYTAGKGTLTSLNTNVPNLNSGYTNIFINEDPEYIKVKNDYIMFVHGWRMLFNERVAFMETAFKRLYWSGYKGRYGAFSWPTGWFYKPSHIYNWLIILALVNDHKQNYGNSEALARQVGRVLKDLLIGDNFNGKNIHIMAHSMGNVVTSEALRNAQSVKIVDDYAAMQVAEVASAYNQTQEFIRHDVKACLTAPDITGPEEAWRCYNMTADGWIDNVFDMPPNYYSFEIPDEHGATSPDLEVEIASMEAWGPSYYSNIGLAAGKITNLYNETDAALDAWEFNQLTKPDKISDDGPEYGYEHHTVCTPYEICDPYPDHGEEQVTDEYYTVNVDDDNVEVRVPLNWTGSIPTDKESSDILGHIIPARTNALGQVDGYGETSVIKDGNAINMNREFHFGNSNFDHSAQFYTNFFEKGGFWIEILKTFKLGRVQ